jgi:hypothetical protein
MEMPVDRTTVEPGGCSGGSALLTVVQEDKRLLRPDQALSFAEEARFCGANLRCCVRVSNEEDFV